MERREQSRWRSPVLWAAVWTQVLALLLTLNIVNVGLEDTARMVIAGVLELFILFGVLNDPTDKEHF